MARERYRRGGTAPNQVCICVDEIREGEFGGKSLQPLQPESLGISQSDRTAGRNGKLL